MKTFCSLLLVKLLGSSCLTYGQTQTPEEQARLVQAVLESERLMAAAGEQIAQSAPYVFVGRPLTGEDQRDRTGRYQHTTIVQVLEVLRGGHAIRPGTIAITDTIQTPRQMGPLVPPTPQEITQDTGHSFYEYGTWGVYFCEPSSLPVPLNPYRTDNRLNIKFYKSSYSARLEAGQAFIMRTDGCHPGIVIHGLGQSFYSEADVHAYLTRFPQLKPVSKPVASYPWVDFSGERMRGTAKQLKIRSGH